MILQQAPRFGPAPQARPQPRRGTFALEPVEALPRLAERVNALAERSLESNPFFLPAILAPAIKALGGKGLKLATFSDREDLRLFVPVIATGGRLLSSPKLTVWTHPYAPLGAPLIERDLAPQVADSLIKHLRTSGRTLFSIPDLPLQGEAAQCLQKSAERWGFWIEAAREMRPVLNPRHGGGAANFEQMATHKRRRELDRQLRRLCDMGAVSFMSARTASEIEAAFNIFITLEASGWKGRRGTALQKRRSTHEFARIAVMQLAQTGHAAIDVIRVGDRPVAALIRFDHGGLSIPWKIAYDESFSAFSPGRQLICDETRRWLSDPTVRRVDPVCEEGNPLFAGLWRDREAYGTLIVSTRRLAIGARLRAGMINARTSARKVAKSLLYRPPRPASAKPPVKSAAEKRTKRRREA
jgi:hypothetical protein